MSAHSLTEENVLESFETSPEFNETLPAPLEGMVLNKSGVHVWEASEQTQLMRVLILGTSAPTYYATQKELETEAKELIRKFISDGHGLIVLEKALDVYQTNRAPKLKPFFEVMAMLMVPSVPDDVRLLAIHAIPSFRTFSHLYEWKSLHKESCGSKGFGRGIKKAIFDLVEKYNAKPRQLAYQVIKYGARYGWSFNDIIKCAHIKGDALPPASGIVITYVVKGIDAARERACSMMDKPDVSMIIDYLNAVTLAKTEGTDLTVLCELIQRWTLPRECLHTSVLNDVNVWKALLMSSDGRVVMPITALIRNLGKMSSIGLFDGEENQTIVDGVCQHLTNVGVLQKGRVHPVTLLSAKLVYEQGRGDKGSLSWPINPNIVGALESAFYVAYLVVKPTGKRIFHGFDASGSMQSCTCAMPKLTAQMACAAMAMAFARSEDLFTQKFFIFATKSEYDRSRGKGDGRSTCGYYGGYGSRVHEDVGVTIHITNAMNLRTAMGEINVGNGGGTDCSLPMIQAIAEFNRGLYLSGLTLEEYRATNPTVGVYDCFIIYTDNDTNSHGEHPSDALERYRVLTGINAKLIVIATEPGSHTIGRPTDDNTLDIAGFDANAPMLIRQHIMGSALEDPDNESDVEDDA
jgi:60 kDa SS-A/Ro ribonucleoprotein